MFPKAQSFPKDAQLFQKMPNYFKKLPKMDFNWQISLLISDLSVVRFSATRFGEISPLWQNIQYWANIWGYI